MAKVNLSDLLELFEAKIISGKIVVTRCFQVESVSILEVIFGGHFIQVLQGLMILFLHKITICVHDVTLAVGRVKWEYLIENVWGLFVSLTAKNAQTLAVQNLCTFGVVLQ
jgi:hypothetical protein